MGTSTERIRASYATVCESLNELNTAFRQMKIQVDLSLPDK